MFVFVFCILTQAKQSRIYVCPSPMCVYVHEEYKLVFIRPNMIHLPFDHHSTEEDRLLSCAFGMGLAVENTAEYNQFLRQPLDGSKFTIELIPHTVFHVIYPTEHNKKYNCLKNINIILVPKNPLNGKIKKDKLPKIKIEALSKSKTKSKVKFEAQTLKYYRKPKTNRNDNNNGNNSISNEINSISNGRYNSRNNISNEMKNEDISHDDIVNNLTNINSEMRLRNVLYFNQEQFSPFSSFDNFNFNSNTNEMKMSNTRYNNTMKVTNISTNQQQSSNLSSIIDDYKLQNGNFANTTGVSNLNSTVAKNQVQSSLISSISNFNFDSTLNNGSNRTNSHKLSYNFDLTLSNGLNNFQIPIVNNCLPILKLFAPKNSDPSYITTTMDNESTRNFNAFQKMQAYQRFYDQIQSTNNNIDKENIGIVSTTSEQNGMTITMTSNVNTSEITTNEMKSNEIVPNDNNSRMINNGMRNVRDNSNQVTNINNDMIKQQIIFQKSMNIRRNISNLNQTFALQLILQNNLSINALSLLSKLNEIDVNLKSNDCIPLTLKQAEAIRLLIENFEKFQNTNK